MSKRTIKRSAAQEHALVHRVAANYLSVRTAGEVRFIKDTGPEGRVLPEAYEYNPRAKKPLAKVLWSVSVALGHLISAHSTFSKIKAVSISPDGKLGGSGFIQDLKGMRKQMTEGVEMLSAIQDTLYDELKAPHWEAKSIGISKTEDAEAEQLLDESDQISMDPGAFVEREYKEDVQTKTSRTRRRRP